MPLVPRQWVPDFCRLPTLFAVIIAAELVVVVLALSPLSVEPFNLPDFGSESLLAVWIALTSAMLLCKLREALSRMPVLFSAIVAWGIPVAVSLIGAWVLLQIDLGLGLLLGQPRANPMRFMLSIGALTGLIGAAALRYAYVTEQWRQQVQTQAKAEVDALQARIRPHFLFNSMNTIASLVRSDPPRAERAIEDLSDLFRAALGAGEGDATLKEEVDLAERFLAIEHLRLGQRLQVDWQRDEPLPWTLKMPRLILQPLLENAVIHGIAPLPDGGTIRVALEQVGNVLTIDIGNPCPVKPVASAGSGHAQQSIAQRLRYRFGEQAQLITRRDAGYHVCSLRIPVAKEQT